MSSARRWRAQEPANDADALPVKASLTTAARPVLPFAATCLLAFAATALWMKGTDWPLVAAAGVVAAVITLAAATAPWSRGVRRALPLLPFAVDGVLGLLRQAEGGSTSGYAPLAIIVVIWVGLTEGKKAVAAATACTTALFAVPIMVVGSPLYPSNAWRGVVLWTVVGAVVGGVVHRVVDQQRASAALVTARTVDLDRLIAAQSTISANGHDVDTVMSVVAAEALAVAGGDGACVELLEGEEVVCSAGAGSAAGFVGMRLPADASITGECFRTGRVLICTDSEQDSRVGREACRAVSARSMIVVPLAANGAVTGVLIVWSGVPDHFRGHEAQLLSLLADTSSSALVRAEFITLLTAQAVTDELTGLPNRRAWHERLDHALVRSRRNGQPLSVLLLDLDNFKQVNDAQGHAAGDRVLKEISAAWLSVLRETDLLGRVGGDEFAVILEDTDEAAALRVISRLDAVSNGHSRASTGLAVWDRTEPADALLARADAVMYEKKGARHAEQAGRC